MEKLFLVFKGMTIGIANVIPGVSGGTFAFIFGIYDKLTEAIGNFATNKSKRKEYVIFLFFVVIGVGAGIGFFSKILNYLLSRQFSRQVSYSLFIGLIGGSIPFIVKSHHEMKLNIQRILIFLVGVAAVLSVAIIASQSEGEGTTSVAALSFGRGIWLFICGILGGGAMIIPGFSGSALWVSIGEYENIYGVYMGDPAAYWLPLVIVVAGIVVGIVFLAKTIDVCFKKIPAGTLYFILGLMAASLFQVWGKVSENFITTPAALISVSAAFIVGFALAWLTSRIQKS